MATCTKKTSKLPVPVNKKSKGKKKCDVCLLEEGFDKLLQSKSKSLLKKYLTPCIFKTLLNRKTSYGSTLLDVVQSGFIYPESTIGVYAPDPEAYHTFAELYTPIIADYHRLSPDGKHPPKKFGDTELFDDLDPEKKYIIKTRIIASRSLKGYPFFPKMSKCQFCEVEGLCREIFSRLSGECYGKYYSLESMTDGEKTYMREDNFLFNDLDRFAAAGQASKFWPIARGMYYNMVKTFAIWVNEIDHLRIMSIQKDGNFKECYDRFIRGMEQLDNGGEYSKDCRLGYLTFDPVYLGTGLCVTTQIKLPNLALDPDRMAGICKEFHLDLIEMRSRNPALMAQGELFEVENKRKLGFTEFEVVAEFYNGLVALIDAEEQLENEVEGKEGEEKTESETKA